MICLLYRINGSFTHRNSKRKAPKAPSPLGSPTAKDQSPPPAISRERPGGGSSRGNMGVVSNAGDAPPTKTAKKEEPPPTSPAKRERIVRTSFVLLAVTIVLVIAIATGFLNM